MTSDSRRHVLSCPMQVVWTLRGSGIGAAADSARRLAATAHTEPVPRDWSSGARKDWPARVDAPTPLTTATSATPSTALPVDPRHLYNRGPSSGGSGGGGSGYGSSATTPVRVPDHGSAVPSYTHQPSPTSGSHYQHQQQQRQQQQQQQQSTVSGASLHGRYPSASDGPVSSASSVSSVSSYRRDDNPSSTPAGRCVRWSSMV